VKIAISGWALVSVYPYQLNNWGEWLCAEQQDTQSRNQLL